MAKLNEYPEESELVVGTVREVQRFGAFITLEEYPGKEGFCHIREVAPGWVKRIRDHVREQQRVVCKVHAVDTNKGHVDLSIKSVNEHQRRETIQAWKNEQKADKFMEIVAERSGKTVDEIMAEYGAQLIEVFGSLYDGFLEAAELGADVFAEEGLTGDWIPAFVEFAKENIQASFVEITGYVDVETRAANGVDDINDSLAEAEKSEFDDVAIHVQYLGSPTYRVIVKAPDYKIAEDQLKQAADRAVAAIAERGGTGQFHRELEEKK